MRSELTIRLTDLIASKANVAQLDALKVIDSVIPLRMASYWRYNPLYETVSIGCRLHYSANPIVLEEHIHAVSGSLIGLMLSRCGSEGLEFLRIPDVSSSKFRSLHKHPQRIKDLGLKELVSIPINKHSDEKTIKSTSGVVNLYVMGDAIISNDEIIFIKNMFSILDQKALAHKKQTVSARIMEALHESTSGISINSLNNIVSKILPDVLSVDACSLYEWSHRKHTYIVAATTGLRDLHDCRHAVDNRGVGLVGEAAVANKVVVISDTSNKHEIMRVFGHEKTDGEIDLNVEATTAPMRSVMLCPIHNPAAAPDDPAIGIIKFVNKKCRLSAFVDLFCPEDIELAKEVARLLALYEDHQRLERSRIAFALQFGHEAQAPSVGIKGSAERLIRHHATGTLTDRQQVSILENIRSFADLLIAFSDSVTYGYADKRLSFKNRYRIRSTNMRSVIEQARRIVIPYCRMEKISFDDIQIIGSYPDYYIDERAITQVFYNLFTNGIKYRDRKSGIFKINVTCSSASRNIILSNIHNKDSSRATIAVRGVHIDVQDFGIGVADSYKDKIFSEGYRIPETSAVEMRGSGIGLSIVKNIVEDFGGRVFLARGENPTTFRIFLPELLSSLEYINRRDVEDRQGTSR